MTEPEIRAATRWERGIYTFVRAAVVGFSKLFWRLEVHGTEHVPATGSFILSAIHRSNLDTPIVAAVTKRRLRYMGKDSMWKVQPAGRFFTALGGFPVARGTADRAAMNKCLAVVASGEPLVMFPEGTRQSGPKIQELFDGPAFVASRTGVPILPVGIGGAERAMPVGAKFIRPVKITIVIGEPLRPEPHADGERVPRRVVKELTARLSDAIQPLFDEAQRRAGNL